MIKTRFCPSPTGYLHLGNVRTALFSALFGHHAKGHFLLRIEDTDKSRSDAQYTTVLMQDLRWLGLMWDEGPEMGGDAGPYYQSQRQAIYDKYYQLLIDKKLVYPCFCSEAQLNLQRVLMQKAGKPPRYSGTCRHLSPEEITEKEVAGVVPTLRFHIDDTAVICFTDLVKGEQRFQGQDLGDFVIRRADGTSPFMFCNAIDDALMGVTHVLRGEDHVANTPRQLAILSALNLMAPQYGHIALIVGADGSPLSKRHGSRSIKVLREEGFLPMAIVNYLARLGHYYGHDQFLSLLELSAQFKTEALAASPAKYNEQQLLFWQSQAVAHLNAEMFWQWLGEEICAMIPLEKRDSFFAMIQPNVRFPLEVKRWASALFDELPEWEPAQHEIIKSAGKAYFTEALIALDRHGPDANKLTAHLKTACGVSGKALFQPLRIALTGLAHGPELAAILPLMDVKTIKRRLEGGMK